MNASLSTPVGGAKLGDFDHIRRPLRGSKIRAGKPPMGQGNQTMKYDIFDRGFALVARATAVVATLCFAAAAPVMAADQPPTNAPAMTPAPAAPPKGEFDNSCTFGLATGQVVKTDCSIN